MTLNLIVSFIVFCASIASGNIGLNLCMQSKTVAVEILTETDDALTCQCQASHVILDSAPSEGYTHTSGIGSHKLHTRAQPWNVARKICNDESAHLAIINSKAEEEVLLRIFRAEQQNIRDGASKEQAFLGIHDFYQEGEWLTIFGEPLNSTGYSHWSTSWWGTHQPDNKDNNQNCGALVLKGGGLDDVYCHENFAFFCELPLSCAE